MSFIISWVSSVPIYIIIGSVYLLMTSFHSANPHLLLLVAKIWSLFLWGFFLFFFLKSSQLWNHAVFFFIWFNFVIIVLSSPTVLLQLAGFPSLYDWVILLCICHNFFIHSPINGHLGNFHVLDIVDNTSLSMGRFRCLFSIVFLFPLDIFSEVELLGHVVLMVLIFWDSSILFFIMAIPGYNPTTSAQGSPFLHIHTSICYLLPCFNSLSSRCRQINSHSNRHKVIDHCGFNLHFFNG